jgi:hypothetical protein
MFDTEKVKIAMPESNNTIENFLILKEQQTHFESGVIRKINLSHLNRGF